MFITAVCVLFLIKLPIENGKFPHPMMGSVKGLFTKKEDYPSNRVTLALTSFLFFFFLVFIRQLGLRRVGELPCLRATVSMAGGLTFSLVNTPVRINPPCRVSSLFADPLSVTAQ